MGFFDLNVPYLERDGASTTAAQESAAAACKAARLRVVVKAMELGYSGVAYNRSIRGVVSDFDRCKIIPFDLSSLLSAAPGLAAAARFHREVLGVSTSSRFRQYSRLTVVVDSAQGATALSSGSAVFRSYHLVAARPLNQIAFDQICKASEVDLISIDFSQKLPFRLKLPMVKAAIERGVYFEISYSPLISDVHVRRYMLTDAKVLVDLTRGKNLIFSSGASCVTDFRGPYDVMNLFSLLGLSMEKAKLAVSKNCSCLLNSALRRKECYDEAIRIEKVLTRTQANSDWFPDWTDWDPISSGDSDLPPLDDILRVISSTGGASQDHVTVKKLGFLPSKEENITKFNGIGESLMGIDEYETEVNEASPEESPQFTRRYENSEPPNTENDNPSCSFMEIDDTGDEDHRLSLDNTLSNAESIDFSSVVENTVAFEVLSGKNLNLDPNGPSLDNTINYNESFDFSSIPENVVASELFPGKNLNLAPDRPSLVDIQNNCGSVDFSSVPENFMISEVFLGKNSNLDPFGSSLDNTQNNCGSVDFLSDPKNVVVSEAYSGKNSNLAPVGSSLDNTRNNCGSVDFLSVPENVVVSEAYLGKNSNLDPDGPPLDKTRNSCGSVDFSSVPEDVAVSEVFSGKTSKLDQDTPLLNNTLNSHENVDFSSVPEKVVVSEVFLGKNLNLYPDRCEAIPVSSPRTGYLMNVSDTLCQKEFKESRGNGGVKIVSFPDSDSSLLLSSKDERDAREENLEREESEKSVTIGEFDSLSSPERIRSLKVSVIDSTLSREILVNVDEVNASPAPFGCAIQNPKRRKVRLLPPRRLLFASKHCIHRFLFKRIGRQLNGSRRHSVRREPNNTS